jgi:hypothetical protein
LIQKVRKTAQSHGHIHETRRARWYALSNAFRAGHGLHVPRAVRWAEFLRLELGAEARLTVLASASPNPTTTAFGASEVAVLRAFALARAITAHASPLRGELGCQGRINIKAENLVSSIICVCINVNAQQRILTIFKQL